MFLILNLSIALRMPLNSLTDFANFSLAVMREWGSDTEAEHALLFALLNNRRAARLSFKHQTESQGEFERLQPHCKYA